MFMIAVSAGESDRMRPKMRRAVITSLESDNGLDEREIQFDFRSLDDADRVLVFIERQGRWECATVRVANGGDAVVDIRGHDSISFERALAMGIRRVLH
jgi:hypothetical protein